MDWTATDRGKSAAQYKELCKQIENSKYGNDPKILTWGEHRIVNRINQIMC